jgi:TolB-like protein
VKGEEIDRRADLWSLGAVLYEMITGQIPFKGDREQAVVFSILNEEPGPVTGLRTGVPLELERIVEKCLTKIPAERYQTPEGLMADLRPLQRDITTLAVSPRGTVPAGTIGRLTPRWPWVAGLAVVAVVATAIMVRLFSPSVQSPLADRKMLVVLPFENLGPPEDAYFAAGMTEEITSRLASVRSLGVISRKSAVHYAETDKTIKQIGDELDVDYVLEGTVRWARVPGELGRVRITPQLIRVSDDTHIWADVYEHVMEDVWFLAISCG